MNILLVAATAPEIDPKLLAKHREVELLLTGVGMLGTAFQLGRQMAQKQYDWVVQAGIAGSYRRDWRLGSVVEVISEQIHDLGIEEKDGRFRSVFDIGLLGKNDFPFLNGILTNKKRTNLPAGKGLTVNRVHGEAIHIDQTKKRYAAEVETMEGAAFFYACLMQKTNFVAIRSISNYVEPRNRAAWDIPLAVKNLNKELDALINDLKSR